VKKVDFLFATVILPYLFSCFLFQCYEFGHTEPGSNPKHPSSLHDSWKTRLGRRWTGNHDFLGAECKCTALYVHGETWTL